MRRWEKLRKSSSLREWGSEYFRVLSRINRLAEMAAHLNFKCIYLKEIHATTLNNLLQPVRFFAAGTEGDSWLGFARHARWKRKGTRELRLLTGECPESGTTQSKIEDGEN